MNAKLVVINSCSSQQEIMLESLPAIVGRADDAAIRIPDRWVSRRHCEIDAVQGRLVVRDLESRHGTFINGQVVISEAPLLPGDKLSVGTSIFLASYDHSIEVAADAEQQACAV